jgi:AraC-like DNA-binding protein
MNIEQSSIDQLHPLMLNVGLARHNADWNWQNVNSPFLRIYYVVDGHANLVIGNKVQKLTPGHLYIVPQFTTHSYECDGYFVHYYVHIYEDAGMDTGFLERFAFPTEVTADDTDIHLFERLVKLNPYMSLEHSDPSTYDNDSTLASNILRNKQRTLDNRIESRGILYILLSRFFKYAHPKDTVTDDRIEKSIIYIRKHLNEPLHISKLAENCCISKGHFIRLFAKETGYTPVQYINLKKIEKAQLLLVTANLSLTCFIHRMTLS